MNAKILRPVRQILCDTLYFNRKMNLSDVISQIYIVYLASYPGTEHMRTG